MDKSVQYGILFVFCLFVCYLIYSALFKDKPAVQTAPSGYMPPVVKPAPVVKPPPVVELSPMEKYILDERNNVPEVIVPVDRKILKISDPIDLARLNKEILLGFNSPNGLSPYQFKNFSALFYTNKKTLKKNVFIANLTSANPNSRLPSADKFMLVDAGAGKVFIKHVRSGFYLSLVQALDNYEGPRQDLSGPMKILTLVENPQDEKWTITNVGVGVYKLIYKNGEEMSVSSLGSHGLFAGNHFSQFVGHSNYDAWNKKTLYSAEETPNLTITIL